MGYIKSNLIPGERVKFETRYHWIIYLSLIAVFTLFLLPYLWRRFSEFAVTNKRVIMKEGIVSRRTCEMDLDKVESVKVSQSILGRILHYGTVEFIGTGGTKERFKRIPEPERFRKKIYMSRAEIGS